MVSDIHANRQAWQAVLADIIVQGADAMLCLGDVVGYGPRPREVLESVFQECDEVLLGNHDAVVGGFRGTDTFNDNARRVIEWTQQQLGPSAPESFREVPLILKGERFLAAHGEVADPERFWYMEEEEDARENFDACDVPILFVGHTHHSGIFILDEQTSGIQRYEATDFTMQPGRRYAVNVGSVGDPRDPVIGASYCLFDQESGAVWFRRISFNITAYRIDLARSTLEIKPYFMVRLEEREDAPSADESWSVRVDHETAAGAADADPEERETIQRESIADRLAQSEVVRRLREKRQAAIEAAIREEQRKQEEAEREAVLRRQRIVEAWATKQKERTQRDSASLETIRDRIEKKKQASAETRARQEEGDRKRDEEKKKRRLQMQKTLADKAARKREERLKAKQAERELIRRLLEQKRRTAHDKENGEDDQSSVAGDQQDPPGRVTDC